MATYNQMQVQQKPKFSVAITTKGYQSLISNTLRDPARARRFTASITSAVAVNPALQECDAGTILAGALLGESLNLSPSPQLGQYYLVPFKQKAKYDRNNRLIRPESVTAQFVLGYKGYIQLALRSGQYKDLDVMVIKQGEYLGKDPETGKAKFQFVEDDDQRDALPTVGYMAYFEYLNGFRKVLYWSKEKMMTHADTYSKAFSRKNYEDLMAGKVPESEMWKYSSFWYKNFDDMAKKTLLRQLISRWGVMSIEMTKAMESDNAVATVSDNNEIITEPEPMPGASEQPELHTGKPEVGDGQALPHVDIAQSEPTTAEPVVEYTGRTRISDCVITSFKSDISADNKNGSKFTVSLKVINRVSAEYVASGEQMMSAQDANASKKVSKSQTKSTTADGLHTTVSQTISSSAYSSYVNSYANKAASSSGPSGRTTRAYSAA